MKSQREILRRDIRRKRCGGGDSKKTRGGKRTKKGENSKCHKNIENHSGGEKINANLKYKVGEWGENDFLEGE